MRVRSVPLFEFMPYGAPELLECSPVHLARAVALGALGWSIAFVMLAASGLLRVPPSPHRLPPRIEITIPHAPVPAPPAPARATASKRARPPGHPVPVRAPAAAEKVAIETKSGEGAAAPGDSRQAISGAVPVSDGPGVIPATEHAYEMHEVEQLPEVVHAPRPLYPSFAREAQVEGLVVVRVLVGRDGKVERAEIEHSIPLLDQAALDATRNWAFNPARVSGRPVAVWIVIPFRFRLH